jgi:hypothetical protein
MYPLSPQHVFAGAMNLAQTAWMNECMGTTPAAAALYQQAGQGMTACMQMMGPQTPDFVFYWLGSCQVRLALLNSGYPGAARYWLAQALPNFQAACQRNPGQPAYKMAVDQTAMVLGQLNGNVPVLQPVAPNTPKSTAPPAPANGKSGLEKLKDGMAVVKTGLELFKGLMDMFGASKGANGMAGYGNMFNAGGNMGFDWTGGGYSQMW